MIQSSKPAGVFTRRRNMPDSASNFLLKKNEKLWRMRCQRVCLWCANKGVGVIKCRTLYLAHLLDPCSDYLTTVCIYSWEKTTWQLYSNILSGGDSVDIAASELRWFLFGSCCFGNSFTPSSHSPVLASCDFAHFSKPLFYLQDCQLMVRRGFPGKSSWPWRLHLSHTRFVLAFYGYWLYDAHLCGCLSKNKLTFHNFLVGFRSGGVGHLAQERPALVTAPCYPGI